MHVNKYIRISQDIYLQGVSPILKCYLKIDNLNYTEGYLLCVIAYSIDDFHMSFIYVRLSRTLECFKR